MKKNEEYPEKKNRSKVYIITTVIASLCIGICFVTGCFSTQQEEVLLEQTTSKKQKKSYDNLVDQWNRSVLAADLNRSFELPRQYDEQFFTKLNGLLNQTEKYEKFVSKNQCVLKTGKDIFIPSIQYANFIKESQLPYKVNFDQNYTEDEIIQELKKVTNSKYIDSKMLKKIAYLHSFKLFFKDNKKKFYKKGFSEYIRKYETYLKAVGRCK